MKFSEKWLRSFVDPALDTRGLADALTFAGIEVEGIESALDDCLLTTKPTPNRGDCLSILGIAREVAAITGAVLHVPQIAPVAAAISEKLSVGIEAAAACPRYSGRLVRAVDARAATPAWMKDRLERSGVRSISAIVDITNYVMLEVGQPLHAFDASRLEGGIRVRHALKGEKLELLNGETPALASDYLLIADEKKAIALAGIMGGSATGVTDTTRDIFIESAYFAPESIAGKSRALGFSSDSAFRFERGVDFDGTARALEQATRLVIEICGGQAGPVSEAVAALPERKPVKLRLNRASRVLGIPVDRIETADILRRLDFAPTESDGVFTVKPPSYRFDITIEEDLIEEVARIYGYGRVSAAAPIAANRMLAAPETLRTRAAVRNVLVHRDYHEAVTYSFVDRTWEEDFCANAHPVALANPIASQLSVMRSSLIGGLVDCVAFNVRHKQPRVRVFEVGRCFMKADEGYSQPVRVGAAAYGDALPEQWGAGQRRVDFYDVKGDLEALFAPRMIRFEPSSHPALHPGKSARIACDSQELGWLGELHPRWQAKYDLPQPVVLFEVDYDALAAVRLAAYHEVPKFPPVRRDLAAVFDENVSHQSVLAALFGGKPDIVTGIRLFDVYRGKGLEKGKKSLAFSVLLQDTRKTLTDAEVESAVSRLREVLRDRFGATLR